MSYPILHLYVQLDSKKFLSSQTATPCSNVKLPGEHSISTKSLRSCTVTFGGV